MKAIVLHETGGPEQLKWEDVPDPHPGLGEAVVRLKAAALNHRDVWIRRGLYAGIRLPIILGSDGAGIVDEVGPDVDTSWLGQSVVINPGLDWGENQLAQGPDFIILGLPWNGTYAEKVKVPASNLQAKPAPLSFEEAAAFPLASLTAYRALLTRAALRPGETLLITGIGGGVSTFALQLALKVGARVIVTSGSGLKLDKARELGAEAGFNYLGSDWEKQIQEYAQPGGLDVILDSAGGETFQKCLQIIRPGGRLITYGATTGAVKELPIRSIFWKQASILGSTMGSPAEFKEMLKWFQTGDLKPLMDQIFPLAEAGAAHQRMDAGEQFGKIVLRIS